MSIDVRWRRDGEVVVASVSGRIDSTGSEEFRKLLDEGIESGDRRLVLDFGDVGYINSSGLRVCLKLAKRFGGSRFAVCGLSGAVGEIFSISGFDKMVRIHSTCEEALGDLRGG